MNKTIISIIAFSFGMLASVSANAEWQETTSGQNRNSASMQEFGQALPPIGHVGFCRRYPGECAGETALHQPFELTEERRKEMQEVNNLVNEIVRPVTDQDLYGRIEHWTYPAGMGDCEDYVLLKRKLLMERGWPASALLITVVRDENRDGHAVLTARTYEGDFLLDNKHSKIMSWNQSPYLFIKRQARWNPQTWISLSVPSTHRLRSSPVAANR